MSRKNRQKVHREARLAAEARAQARAQARRDAKIAKARANDTVRALLAGRPTVGRRLLATENPVIAQLTANMKAGRIPAPLQRRVLTLARACEHAVPSLFTTFQLPMLLLLADQIWANPPHLLGSLRGSTARREQTLISHLLTRFPVPAFLLAGIDVEGSWVIRIPEEDRWIVGLVAWLGQGHPARELPGSELLPTPLTRRMLSLFLTAPASMSPILALRSAQVRGFGGDPRWAHQLCRAGLGALKGGNPQVGEAFWHRVIQWLVAQPMLPIAQLELLLRHIERQRREGLADERRPEAWRRTVSAMVHEAERDAQRRWREERFPDSGLLVGAIDEQWSVVALNNPRALYEEGKEMSHCAGTYRSLARRGKVALFSVQHAGRRSVTVEVVLGAHRVTQVKGKANRAASAAELRVVHQWAAVNGLRMV